DCGLGSRDKFGDGPLPVVHPDFWLKTWRVETRDRRRSKEQAGLIRSGERLQAHCGFYDPPPMPKATPGGFRAGNDGLGVAATEAEHIDLIAPDIEADEGFDDCEHDRIVCPNATID